MGDNEKKKILMIFFFYIIPLAEGIIISIQRDMGENRYESIQRKLQEFVDLFQTDAQYELEGRLGKFRDGIFISGVDDAYFDYVQQMLAKSACWSSKAREQISVDYYYRNPTHSGNASDENQQELKGLPENDEKYTELSQTKVQSKQNNNIRHTARGGKGQDETVEKVTIASLTVRCPDRPWDLRFSLSKEIPRDLPIGPYDWVRCKLRDSFCFDNIRYDLTKTQSDSDKEIACSSQAQHSSREIEIEILHSEDGEEDKSDKSDKSEAVSEKNQNIAQKLLFGLLQLLGLYKHGEYEHVNLHVVAYIPPSGTAFGKNTVHDTKDERNKNDESKEAYNMTSSKPPPKLPHYTKFVTKRSVEEEMDISMPNEEIHDKYNDTQSYKCGAEHEHEHEYDSDDIFNFCLVSSHAAWMGDGN